MLVLCCCFGEKSASSKNVWIQILLYSWEKEKKYLLSTGVWKEKNIRELGMSWNDCFQEVGIGSVPFLYMIQKLKDNTCKQYSMPSRRIFDLSNLVRHIIWKYGVIFDLSILLFCCGDFRHWKWISKIRLFK